MAGAFQMSGGAPQLKTVVRTCGLVNLLALLLLVPLSYALAPLTPYGVRGPRVNATFRMLRDRIADRAPALGGALDEYVFDGPLVAHRAARAVSYAVPLLVSTAAFLILAAVLHANGPLVDESVVRLLFRIAVAGAIVTFFAYPIFTHDVWLSVVWGRMIANGQNPYYDLFTPEMVGGMPLDHYPTLMTYGPLWAIMSGGASALAGQSALLNFVLLKLMLALFWVLSLAMIVRILSSAPAGDRALAICLFGWLPASVHLTIGEAHNDIAMVFFLLVWLWLVARGHRLFSPVALMASVLIKYVTAPLMVLEGVDAWLRQPETRRTSLAAVALAAGVAAAVFGVFWNGPGFFARLVAESRNYWVFFTPTHALFSLAALVHVPLPWSVAANLMRAIFLAIVAVHALRYWRQRTFPQVATLALSILGAVLFVGVGHVYPWFVLWVLAPAAVAVHSGLLLFIVPVAVCAPFLNLYWLLAPGPEHFQYGSIAFYAVVVPAMLLLRRTPWILGAIPASSGGFVAPPAHPVDERR